MHNRARESREALIAVLSTAASMGIDISELCHLAAVDLREDKALDVQPFITGAINQIGICMTRVIEPR